MAAMTLLAAAVSNADSESSSAGVGMMSDQLTLSAAGHSCTHGIPDADCQAAVYVYEFILSHNLSPPPNYVGGSEFRNDHGQLPSGQYKEYDIYPRPQANNRGPQRLVVDVNDLSRVWYTPDHYGTFIAFGYGSD